MIDTLLDKIGDWNPQLLRELKGRLTPKNIVIAAGISAVSQIFLYLLFQSRLSLTERSLPRILRYCAKIHYVNTIKASMPQCIHNRTGGTNINFSIWSLDFFTTLTIIGIIGLFVVGIYLLIDDLAREEKLGTLNFIRLSPQNSKNILLGKLLGVPVLVYLAILLLFPLHFGLGITAHIPPYLILAFDGIVVVSCFFFYSSALLFALTCTGLGGLQAWLGSGFVFGFLLIMVDYSLDNYSNFMPSYLSLSDWLTIFYPGYLLPYLVAHTPNDLSVVDYLDVNELGYLTWFNLELWRNSVAAFAFTLVNYGLGIFVLWKGLDRRFHNHSISPLSKGQSYWLSSSIVFVLIGFAIQHPVYSSSQQIAYSIFENFLWVLVLQVFLFCCLIAALTPHRKTLQTWSRYRHQTAKQNLRWDLLWGEKSPAILAIALNLVCVSTIFLVTISLLALDNHYFELYRSYLIVGLLVSDGVILLYASLAQWLLLQKTKQRVLWAIATIITLSVLLPIAVSILGILSSNSDFITIDTILLSIVSVFPVLLGEDYAQVTTLFALIGQGIAIAAINVQMTRQLRHLGESEVKALLSENSRSRKQLSGVF
ncbi:MAG: hypothetical protein AAGA60_28225 [Cyanobacteria bacterium P01_E01_bin.42]